MIHHTSSVCGALACIYKSDLPGREIQLAGIIIEGEIGKGNTPTKSLQVSLEVCVCMFPPLQLPLSSYQRSRGGRGT